MESAEQGILEHSHFKYGLDVESEIDIIEHKIEMNSEEDNLIQYNQISDSFKVEPSENEKEATTSTSQFSTQFVDCGPTIKEEKEEENVEFHKPLKSSYALHSFYQSDTYETKSDSVFQVDHCEE